jgi:protein gp37
MNICKPDNNGNATGIEWTKAPGTVAGATLNPVTGCHHRCKWEMPDGVVISCYAEAMANRFNRDKRYEHGFQHNYWHPERLNDPQKKSEPHGIFIGSMSDLFGQWVNAFQIHAVLDMCRETPQHIYFTLTKNPRRMIDFDLPENIWAGCSLPGGSLSRHRDPVQKMIKSLGYLDAVAATVRWVSLEPLWFDVAEVFRRYVESGLSLPIDWMVIGAGSDGRKVYQPEPEWVEGLLDVAARFDIPVFMKKNIDWSFRLKDFPEV